MPVLFEAIARGFPCDLWYEISCRKTRVSGLPGGEDCKVLQLQPVFAWADTVLDMEHVGMSVLLSVMHNGSIYFH